MSDTLSAPSISPAEQLDSYHHQVVTDPRLDMRYADPMTNVQKVEMVCNLLGASKDEFDLSADYPLAEWVKSGDLGMLRCGLYIADLREEFYGLVMGGEQKEARHDVWEAQAEAGYWMESFDSVLYRRQTGERRPARRVYH